LTPFLKMYREYTTFYNEAISCEKKAVTKDPIFAQTLLNTMNHPLIQGNSLDSFLILPVQRIPRYVLLLQDLMENTESNHPDYKWLQKSLILMKTVANSINDAILEYERRTKCMEIFQLFTFSNDIKWTADNRYLIYQGPLIKQCHNKKEPREVFLFNDTLLYGKIENKLYNIRWMMELEKVIVEGEEDKPELGITNAFVIRSTRKSFYCYAESIKDKEKWLEQLKDTITRRNTIRNRLTISGELYNSATVVTTAAVWKLDNSATECTLCGKAFTFVRRRHHCRKCGSLVDADCSNQKQNVEGVSEKPVRVCLKCCNEK